MSTIVLNKNTIFVNSSLLVDVPGFNFSKQVISIGSLPYDKAPPGFDSSESALLSRIIEKDPSILMMLNFMNKFQPDILITSFFRGTGTHVGYAIDFKPSLPVDAHDMGISPMWNCRPDLADVIDKIHKGSAFRDLLVLIEENHIHLNAVSKSPNLGLTAGVFVKLVMSPRYRKMYGNNETILHKIEGHTAGSIIPVSEFRKLLSSCRFKQRNLEV